MKKSVVLLVIASLFMGCVTTDTGLRTDNNTGRSGPEVNPNSAPQVMATIPELFSPNPDVDKDEMEIAISVNHPVAVKEWHIEIRPNRRDGQAQSAAGTQRAAGQPAEGQTQRAAGQSQRAAGQAAEGQAQRAPGEGRRRGPFFEQDGTGNPPAIWKWDGHGTNGEMVQSATDYQLRLTVVDNFENEGVFEGIISVDVLVKREGDNYKIVVPSIVFPPNSADFRLLSEEEMRGNRRILNLIGRSLARFPAYRIAVEGHSNPTTPIGAQRDREETAELRPLSQNRANAVLEYLTANDFNYRVERARLSAVGRGGTRTVADYDDVEENWKNRRVEFILSRS